MSSSAGILDSLCWSAGARLRTSFSRSASLDSIGFADEPRSRDTSRSGSRRAVYRRFGTSANRPHPPLRPAHASCARRRRPDCVSLPPQPTSRFRRLRTYRAAGAPSGRPPQSAASLRHFRDRRLHEENPQKIGPRDDTDYSSALINHW
jgi:hypothetical protein